jgi:hypothetical protein
MLTLVEELTAVVAAVGQYREALDAGGCSPRLGASHDLHRDSERVREISDCD